MKARTQLPAALLVAALSVFTAGHLHALVVQDDPAELPPLGGPGWYSTKGSSVSYYVNYGGEHPFEGILFAAKDIVVDHFRNVTRHYDGNDLIMDFEANLTASLTHLFGSELEEEVVLTIPGTMSVRLENKLGNMTGTFPLTIESMSFTLLLSHLSPSNPDDPYFQIRAPASPVSTGQMTIRDLGGGKYSNESTLKVYSEASAYNPDAGSWRAFFPDTNQPMSYELLTLQGPELDLSVVGNPREDLVLKFTMRPWVSYQIWGSSDLQSWTLFTTKDSGDGFSLDYTYTIGLQETDERLYVRFGLELIAPPP